MHDVSVRIRFHPAGEIERLEDGSLRFPEGGSVELDGIERRVRAGDEIAVRLEEDGALTLLINGRPADEIPLDS